MCKQLVLGSRCLQFGDSVKYLGVCIVASRRFKCSFEDVKLKFFFVYLNASLLRVNQPVQKLYQCTYSNRIVYPIWRIHVKLYHSINLIFIDRTIWLFVHYAGFLKCIPEKILTACVMRHKLDVPCLTVVFESRKQRFIDKLIDLDHLWPVLRSLYWSLILFFLFAAALVVFILCMSLCVRLWVWFLPAFLTNKDSYILRN